MDKGGRIAAATGVFFKKVGDFADPARAEPQRIAAVRCSVGFVASKIAEWRRF